MAGAWMGAEMAEQPAVLGAFAARRSELGERLRAAAPDPLHGVLLIARGSSDNAAVYGRYVLEIATGRPVGLAAPSIQTLYGARVDYHGYLAIAVSQSGETPEIVTVLESAMRSGAVGVAVTNDAASPLAVAADVVLALEAGDERAVPATKTVTAQLAAFAVLAEALGGLGCSAADWDRMPAAVQAVLDDPDPAAAAAEVIGAAPGIITVGRGLLYGTALEAALKLKETTSILAEGYSAADLRHGPIAVVERDFPVLAFSAAGPAAADMHALCAELEARGADVLRVSDDPAAALSLGGGASDGLPEPLAVLPATVRAQQVALALARLRGLDADAPPGLTKVTPTT